jgi:hypothetical protein
MVSGIAPEFSAEVRTGTATSAAGDDVRSPHGEIGRGVSAVYEVRSGLRGDGVPLVGRRSARRCRGVQAGDDGVVDDRPSERMGEQSPFAVDG